MSIKMLKKVFTICAVSILSCSAASGYEIVIDSAYSSFEEEKSQQDQSIKTQSLMKRSSQVAQNIKELYGSKFAKLSKGEQKYIQDNMDIMRQITHDTLIRIARDNIPNNLRVNSTNFIEFYLYPDRDITDFKFLQNSNYYILDDTTKETIEYAYSKYPKPAQKTLGL